MTIERTAPPAGGIRFTVRALPGLTFIRYPVEVTPPEGTVGFVNTSEWQCAGIFKDGAWRNARGTELKRIPTHWTIMDPEERK